MSNSSEQGWQVVCRSEDVVPGTGVCALVGGRQVAIFRTRKEKALYALDNFDPIGKANVLSRGIQGSIGDQLVVASPLYKQHFVLATGACLEEEVAVPVYSVRENNGLVEVAA
ncbi:nitrite reductase small subunit NirD [Simiduia sp. 21SJ11W-1]|uniref:nitrite reductase small subunit NirD n=1 Tax=Simiduia sp. 21SJ11W-1 TaxID=2909669 RepID=UPI00209EDF32|nr:nitrite reductase small subunit NirD [Simiduia sp. 21SJ11W-1]UTA46881.1 nitrite reductase small subunit NirD [Simiduia sp. 21SJ11W-1]